MATVALPASGGIRKVRSRIDSLAGREEPILEKDALQTASGGAHDLQVRVAPAADARHLAAVLVPDVHAAREGEIAVDDHDLAVVSQVDRLKEKRTHRKEDPDLGSRTPQRPPPSGSESEATVRVAEKADLDAPLGGLDELVAKPGAGPSFREIELGMHVVAGLVDGPRERRRRRALRSALRVVAAVADPRWDDRPGRSVARTRSPAAARRIERRLTGAGHDHSAHERVGWRFRRRPPDPVATSRNRIAPGRERKVSGSAMVLDGLSPDDDKGNQGERDGSERRTSRRAASRTRARSASTTGHYQR
jgi:hypothetical protein